MSMCGRCGEHRSNCECSVFTRIAKLLEKRGCSFPNLCAINPNACGIPECFKKNLSHATRDEVLRSDSVPNPQSDPPGK